MDPAVVLFWTDAIGDDAYTAELVPFADSGKVAGWKIREPRVVPERIYFEANIKSLRQLDYPDNDVNWPIMSPRMREILLPDAVEHRLIPVIMLDDTLSDAEQMANSEGGYAAVQIIDRIDAMDMERSEFVPHEKFPTLARKVRKLVFKDGPLPSLFRLSSYESPLFVSRDARARLDAAGIKGPLYRPLSQINLS